MAYQHLLMLCISQIQAPVQNLVSALHRQHVIMWQSQNNDALLENKMHCDELSETQDNYQMLIINTLGL